MIAAALGLSGCAPGGEPRVAVTGQVTYNGTPVTDASIFFIPDIDKEGHGANAVIWNGRYSIAAESGPSAGELNVLFVDARRDHPSYTSSAKTPPLPLRFSDFGNLKVVIPRRKSFSYDFELSDEPDTPRRSLKGSGTDD